MDEHRNQLCELCGARLSRVKHHRPHGVGRACKKHSIVEKPAPATAPAAAPPTQRSKRPYETLGATQQWKRRREARSSLEAIDCPLEALHPEPPPPAALLHLPTSVREAIRSVEGLRIPCEQTIIQCKKLLATTHATATDTFANGAYVTDPIRFVSVLCAQTPFIAVGGDSGGGHTKLGVTYSFKGVQHFAALLVYAGGDGWEELNGLTAAGHTTFTGDSAGCPHMPISQLSFASTPLASFRHHSISTWVSTIESFSMCTPSCWENSMWRRLSNV